LLEPCYLGFGLLLACSTTDIHIATISRHAGCREIVAHVTNGTYRDLSLVTNSHCFRNILILSSAPLSPSSTRFPLLSRTNASAPFFMANSTKRRSRRLLSAPPSLRAYLAASCRRLVPVFSSSALRLRMSDLDVSHIPNQGK
jgi:hypothetical protein